jgi:hypothetical protein
MTQIIDLVRTNVPVTAAVIVENLHASVFFFLFCKMSFVVAAGSSV